MSLFDALYKLHISAHWHVSIQCFCKSSWLSRSLDLLYLFVIETMDIKWSKLCQLIDSNIIAFVWKYLVRCFIVPKPVRSVNTGHFAHSVSDKNWASWRITRPGYSKTWTTFCVKFLVSWPLGATLKMQKPHNQAKNMQHFVSHLTKTYNC